MNDMSDMSGKSVCSADDVTGTSTSEVSDSDVTDALQPSDKDSSEKQLHGGTKPTSSVAGEEAVAVSCSSKTYKEEVLQRANSQAKSGALKQHVSRWDTREHNTRHITSNSAHGSISLSKANSKSNCDVGGRGGKCWPTNNKEDPTSPSTKEGGKILHAAASRSVARIVITPCSDAPTEDQCTNPSVESDFDNRPELLYEKVPTCCEDITVDWISHVMRQHGRQFGRRLSGVGLMKVEMDGISEAGNEAGGSDPIDKAIVKKELTASNHILSEAFRVIVEVPDPPKQSGGFAEEEEEEEEEEKAAGGNQSNDDKGSNEDSDEDSEEEDFKTAAKAAVKALGVNKKTHYLFVKVPPRNSARFEKITKKNRTLEREVKVYTELLRDLRAFVKDRVGNTVTLNLPNLYHGFTAKNDPGPDGDRSVLVIEDLTQRGFTTKDWFKAKLSHEEVKLALKEMAKFHACGLAYRMSLKEEVQQKYPFLDDDLYTSNMSKELLAKYLDSYLHFLSFLPGIRSGH